MSRLLSKGPTLDLEGKKSNEGKLKNPGFWTSYLTGCVVLINDYGVLRGAKYFTRTASDER